MAYRSVFCSETFSDQVILVTGGGSGIGRCVAHELTTLGAMVVIAGRSESKLQAVAGEISATGGSIETLVLDTREEKEVQEALDGLIGRHSRIDGLVNCAGGQFPALLEELSGKAFNAVVKNNLLGTFHLMRNVLVKSMKANGGNVVSITMDQASGAPLMGHSGASRAGMDSLTKTAALEWARYGVRVNSVAVGYVESSGLETYSDKRALDAFPKFPEYTPIGRWGTEAEISSLVCFLLSPAASYITGQIIQPDGGFSLNKHTPFHQMERPDRFTVYHGFHQTERVVGAQCAGFEERTLTE